MERILKYASGKHALLLAAQLFIITAERSITYLKLSKRMVVPSRHTFGIQSAKKSSSRSLQYFGRGRMFPASVHMKT